MRRELAGDLYTNLAALTRRIVQEFDPLELDNYDLLAESYFDPAQRHFGKSNDASDYDRFGFGVDAETGMLCLHIMAGVLALVEVVFSAQRIREERVSMEQIHNTWQALLIQKGLSPELAQSIPLRFGNEMLQLLASAGTSQGNEKPLR